MPFSMLRNKFPAIGYAQMRGCSDYKRVKASGRAVGHDSRREVKPRSTGTSWRKRARGAKHRNGSGAHAHSLNPTRAADRHRRRGRHPARRAPSLPRTVRVHLPIPRIADRRARNSSTSTMRSKLMWPSAAALARARMVSARAFGTPIRATSAPASVSGEGNRYLMLPTDGMGCPKVLTNRPASSVAPLTVICWPKMARVASSNPSQQPTTRSPGCNSIRSRKIGSVRRLRTMFGQSAYYR